jgi:hypothetical protein
MDALLPAATHDTMRILLHQRRNSIDLRRRGGEWQSETGASLEIEAVFPID